MYALLSMELKGGEYLADCAVAELLNEQGSDAELPKRLWEKTEEQLALIESNGTLPE